MYIICIICNKYAVKFTVCTCKIITWFQRENLVKNLVKSPK